MKSISGKWFGLILAAPLLLQPIAPAWSDDADIVATSDERLLGKIRLWEVERITDDVYGFRYSFYRNIFIVTDEGVIATDPLSLAAATVMREQIAKITDQPVRYVSYSHSHWDHAAGGEALRDEDTQYVAQEICAENFVETPHPDIALPDITYADNYRIELGGKSLEMFYFGPAHDNCMVAMLVEPANMMFLTDVANPPNGWMMFYNPAVSEDRVWNMVRFFDGVQGVIEENDVETVIGGHMTGSFDPVTNRPTIIRGTLGPATVVAERRAFWQALIDAARAELAAGTPPSEVPARVVEKGLLADQIQGYDPGKMLVLMQRMTSYVQTGE